MKKITTLVHTPIMYKIFVDILWMILLIASIYMTAETILPGIISAYISPLLLFSGIFFIFIALSFFARINNISFPQKKKNVIIFMCGISFFSMCVAIASFRFGIIACVLFTVFSAIILTLFYTILHKEILHN